MVVNSWKITYLKEKEHNDHNLECLDHERECVTWSEYTMNHASYHLLVYPNMDLCDSPSVQFL